LPLEFETSPDERILELGLERNLELGLPADVRAFVAHVRTARRRAEKESWVSASIFLSRD
jgi:hypothetical protein